MTIIEITFVTRRCGARRLAMDNDRMLRSRKDRTGPGQFVDHSQSAAHTLSHHLIGLAERELAFFGEAAHDLEEFALLLFHVRQFDRAF